MWLGPGGSVRCNTWIVNVLSDKSLLGQLLLEPYKGGAGDLAVPLSRVSVGRLRERLSGFYIYDSEIVGGFISKFIYIAKLYQI